MTTKLAKNAAQLEHLVAQIEEQKTEIRHQREMNEVLKMRLPDPPVNIKQEGVNIKKEPGLKPQTLSTEQLKFQVKLSEARDQNKKLQIDLDNDCEENLVDAPGAVNVLVANSPGAENETTGSHPMTNSNGQENTSTNEPDQSRVQPNTPSQIPTDDINVTLEEVSNLDAFEDVNRSNDGADNAKMSADDAELATGIAISLDPEFTGLQLELIEFQEKRAAENASVKESKERTDEQETKDKKDAGHGDSSDNDDMEGVE